MYVIERTDQGGGYLKQGGGWTFDLRKVQTFSTQAAADAERCPGNEIAVPLSNLIPSPH